MRWSAIAVMAITIVSAGGARAQQDPYRRFTREPIDPNENNKIVYVPLASAFPGPRPGDQPYDVAAASWYSERLGSRQAKPDRVLDKGSYVLNRFETVNRMLEVVVTRYPAPPAGSPMPQLRITDPRSNISASAFATATPITGGTEFHFQVRPPLQGLVPDASPGNPAAAGQYTLSFLPAKDVPLPPAMRTAGTFSGAGVEARMDQGPPRLPVEERVAGKRLEFRSAHSAPQVTYDERVAGKRQEIRRR